MFRIEALNKNDMFNTPFYLIISRKVAGKVMELALKIKGQLDSSCAAAMRSVAEKANELQNKLNDAPFLPLCSTLQIG